MNRIVIDEAPFFVKHIVDVPKNLANDGKRVLIAELDMDFEDRPFEPMLQLLTIAEYVTNLHAICAESGVMANYSQRGVDKEDQVLVSEKDSYEPRARHYFRTPVDKNLAKPLPPLQQDEPKEKADKSDNEE